MSPVVAIILLILAGLVLLLLEVLVIPGTTVAGVIGFGLLGGGIYIAFNTYGTNAGVASIAATLIITIIVFITAFRSGTWKKLMLNSAIESKIENFEGKIPNIGDEGITLTRLAPMGKVLVNDVEYEAISLNSFVDPKSTIVVSGIESNKIIVKLKL
ncbi:MAG: NfeD family protein [Salinivirgaceae bacterium]|nr:NfeD family protein [Salinivirgaceae bacterium]MDY0280747.1 NfeD family protein [Salinivirgaceae bacterium]